MKGMLLLGLICVCVNGLAAEGKKEFYEPGIMLPDDNGKALVLRSCTSCHTLEGVPAYSKYWGFEHWLAMVDNMIKHGAVLDADEKIVVTRYLSRHYGTDKE